MNSAHLGGRFSILSRLKTLAVFIQCRMRLLYSYSLNPKYSTVIPKSPIKSPSLRRCLVLSSVPMALKTRSIILSPLGYRKSSLRLRPRILIDMWPLSSFWLRKSSKSDLKPRYFVLTSQTPYPIWRQKQVFLSPKFMPIEIVGKLLSGYPSL